MVPVFSTCQTYWDMANYYLPLSETVVGLGVMCVFWAAFSTAKYLWRLVPFFH
jgi:hypothetical protein